MAEFTLSAGSYKSRPLDGTTQILVMKRLLPAFTAVAAAAPAIRAADQTSEGEEPAEARTARIIAALSPVTIALAGLPDADVQFVLDACALVTERRAVNAVGWMPVLIDGIFPNRDDQNIAVRLGIAWNVLMETFGAILPQFGVDAEALRSPSALG